jgi:hypothetical protein
VRKLCWGTAALVVMSTLGAGYVRHSSRNWPNVNGDAIPWLEAFEWVAATLVIAALAGALLGAIVGTVTYLLTRSPFRLLNAGFWTAFWSTSWFALFVIPQMI